MDKRKLSFLQHTDRKPPRDKLYRALGFVSQWWSTDDDIDCTLAQRD